MIILGIDPGSRVTGFGLVDNQTNRIGYIASGHIKVSGDSLPQRLGYIFAAIDDVIKQHSPEQMGIENVFMARNADSALKLGQARGAAICAAHQAGLEIAEYAPREIKQAVVGTGAATKEQVQHMVVSILKLGGTPAPDAADALAAALCHGNQRRMRVQLGGGSAIASRR